MDDGKDVYNQLVEGWLFDAYPLRDKMVFWVKQKNGNTNRLEDSWSNSIYVAADNKSDLKSILSVIVAKQTENNNNNGWLIKDHEFVSRYERITDDTKSEVLKLTLSDSTKALKLARDIERRLDGDGIGKFRLYNVDLPPAQSYFYEHDIFPLAFYKLNNNNCCYCSSWNIKDNVWSTDYKVPDFKTVHLKLNLKKEGKISKHTDKIESILIKQEEQDSQATIVEIQSESEADMIDEFVTEITKKIDPDFIFTDDGDSFTFPYLIHRAEQNGTALILGREPTMSLKRNYKGGTSYFSYGRIYFKPTTVRLFGRIHFDINNSFILNDSGLQGLYEIARICRMPLHTAARASIGKCLSSLQFYYATQKEILIPWKPTLAEHLKTFEDLLVADRGGFIFEPEIGVHEQVAEFDFVSLYPNIMLKKNLSAETIRCSCCPDSKLRVPELHYNICEKRTGIVPTSLRIVLEKRAKYKELLKNSNSAIDSQSKEIYDARQNSLKWILVTSFGYLGFNNAKFGRIDAHIAVCAFDRQILLQTVKIAERHGFRVLHGIVDSIWVKRKRNTKITNMMQDEENYARLQRSIEQKTGFTIPFEGKYKWIAFVHSKVNNALPVANRYFGVFEDGCLKIRGIEARRHDTPMLLSKFQQEILEVMSKGKGKNIGEVKALMPKVNGTFQKYVQLLKQSKIPFEELVFTKRISKNSKEYQKRNTVESNSIHLLDVEGKSLKAGEILEYVITDYYETQSKNRRAIPIELINENTTSYDVRRYVELLAETCNSVIEPFGLTVVV